MKRISLVLLLSVVLSACSVVHSAELSNARSRWQAANITHYRYQLKVACFCAFSDMMPLSIEVENGNVVSMQYRDGTAVPAEQRAVFESYDTIDKLLDFTSQSLKDADEIQAVYDPSQGFPRSVQIDFIKQAADDELSLFVTNFQPVR